MAEEKTTSPAVSESKAPTENKPGASALKITAYDIALSQLKMDMRYYFLLEGDYANAFRKHFEDNEPLMKKSGVSARKFLEYVRESFDRYKQTHGLMPLDPMNPKAFQYVNESAGELIQKFKQRFGGK